MSGTNQTQQIKALGKSLTYRTQPVSWETWEKQQKLIKHQTGPGEWDKQARADCEARNETVQRSVKAYRSNATYADSQARIESTRNARPLNTTITVEPIHYVPNEPKEITDITYRHVAVMFASGTRAQGDEYGRIVEEYLAIIKALPAEAKIALRCAYVFSRKAPREEREDLMQELTLRLLQARVADERMAYCVARCDWKDWWRAYKVRAHLSLDMDVSESGRLAVDGNNVATDENVNTLADTLIDSIRYETLVDGKLDCQRIWKRLPDNIRAIVSKRLRGKPMTGNERVTLYRYQHSTDGIAIRASVN